MPAPTTPFVDGQDADATLMNREFRDRFRWLLGTTKPAFMGYSTATSFVLNPAGSPVPINTEVYKIGFTHSANADSIVAPETGWYKGAIGVGMDSTSAGTSIVVKPALFKNGTCAGGSNSTCSGHTIYQLATSGAMATDVDFAEGAVPFHIKLTAGDVLRFTATGSWTGSQMSSWVATDDVKAYINIVWDGE